MVTYPVGEATYDAGFSAVAGASATAEARSSTVWPAWGKWLLSTGGDARVSVIVSAPGGDATTRNRKVASSGPQAMVGTPSALTDTISTRIIWLSAWR